MRNVLPALVLSCAALCASPTPAQTSLAAPPPGPSWARVQALTANTSLHIKATTYNSSCRLKLVEADTLTCVSGDGAKTEVYQRSDIKSIKVPHHGRSTLVGLAIGAGAGIIIGASEHDGIVSRGALAASGAIVFGGIGALIGALTDFTRTTVYRA